MGIKQPQKFSHYKNIDTPTMVTYKLEDFSGKQIHRHHSNVVPYYPKVLFDQEQRKKFFTDNSLLQIHLKKPTITETNSVSLVQTDQLYHQTLTNTAPNHHITRLDYPILTRKSTILEQFAYESNRQKTAETTVKNFAFTNHKPVMHTYTTIIPFKMSSLALLS